MVKILCERILKLSQLSFIVEIDFRMNGVKKET